MADLIQALRNRLISSTSITDLVSSKISLGHTRTSHEAPYVVLSRITENPEHHFAGANALTSCILQVDIITSSAGDASGIYEAMRNLMDGYRGTIAVGAGSVSIYQCHFQGVRDDYTPPADGDEDGHHRKSFEMNIWYNGITPDLIVVED